ncbi:hypothetical protein GCM10010193_37360 [Kitasatospora atroaurantiaca]
MDVDGALQSDDVEGDGVRQEVGALVLAQLLVGDDAWGPTVGGDRLLPLEVAGGGFPHEAADGRGVRAGVTHGNATLLLEPADASIDCVPNLATWRG